VGLTYSELMSQSVTTTSLTTNFPTTANKNLVGNNVVAQEFSASYFSFDRRVAIYNTDVRQLYPHWPTPTIIIADGAYGIGGFPGDPLTTAGLIDWYEPHIAAWSARATPQTTLWLWNTEIGWATIHPLLRKYGWEYVSCHTWDKGIQHIAGNSNTKTLRKLPVVTEICVQYVKRPEFIVHGQKMSLKEWLRYEWQRTGLPWSLANVACGVKDAATRKYLTTCHLWYCPPAEVFEKLATYANNYGAPAGLPYFSSNGVHPLSAKEWANLRAKFYCPIGVTNVWSEPPLNGKERIKVQNKSIHLNQKPLKLMKLIISLSSEVNDLLWEPFGGLCSASLAAQQLHRRCLAAEINPYIYHCALNRFTTLSNQPSLFT
jgi:hypothetical protein